MAFEAARRLRYRLSRLVARESGARLRAISDNQKLVRKLADARDDASVQARGFALLEIGLDLKDVGWFDGAARSLEEAETLLRRFRQTRDQAVYAAVNRAIALMSLERYEKAAEILGGVVEEVGVGGSLADVEAVGEGAGGVIPAAAVAMWLFLLDKLGRVEEAGRAAELVITEFCEGETDTRRTALADAFRLRGVAAHARGDRQLSLVALDEAIKRSGFQDQDDLGFVAIQARAMAERVCVLRELEREEEALAACDEVLSRFGSVRDKTVEEAVARARREKAALSGHPDAGAASR